MLAQLRVRDLGVIADLELSLGSGLTALTGETGAGKTLVVEALDLLLGGRADPAMVRSGAAEAFVEGRFVAGEDEDAPELILARAVPAAGRSRAFADGRMVPVARLEELGGDLVDLYGQHAHQSLLRSASQREALDRFAGIDHAPVQALRRSLQHVGRRLAELGGDGRARLRELDLLRFELDEITAAAITSAGEDEELAVAEERLASAAALREATTQAYAALRGDDAAGALGLIGDAVAQLSASPVLAHLAQRLRALEVELDDAAAEVRRASETFEEDPERLAAVRARRHLLRQLVRKHGDDLAAVLKAGTQAAARIAELESTDAQREALERERAAAESALALAEEKIGAQRRRAAPKLARAVEARLRALALARARLELALPESGLADEVEFLLGANPGEPALPLAKVASGGELARAMLALRLVLTSAPPTLVFDEVDAGIGGEAAVAVGRALAELAQTRQVLVVTHLPQVAAYAQHQLVVEKVTAGRRTLTQVTPVAGEARVAELSRMLAGRRDSDAARRHAEELLAEAAAH